MVKSDGGESMSNQEVMDIYADLNQKYIKRGDRIEELKAAIREYIQAESWDGEQFSRPEWADEKLQEVLNDE